MGIFSKRSLSSKQEDRKSGNFGSQRVFYCVTPDKKIKLIGNSPKQFKIIEYSEFEANYKVIEIPSFTLSQYRLYLIWLNYTSRLIKKCLSTLLAS